MMSDDDMDAFDVPMMRSSFSSTQEYNNYSALSKAEQRKNNKPIMEKRRRARINKCLNELKTLILDATNKDPSRHTKLEKADILEMTVKHLQSIQRQHFSMAVATDPTIVQKFKTGFEECASEVSRYIGHLDGVDTGMRQRLMKHLNNFASGFEEDDHNNNGGDSSDSNNNRDHISYQGLHLIPSRLPTGELALLLPKSSSLSTLFPPPAAVATVMETPSRMSAFTAIRGNEKSPQGEIEASEVSSTSNDAPPKGEKLEKSFQPTASLLIPVSELGSEYMKTCRFPIIKDTKVLKPLKVYTDADSAGKSPIDFSIRREVFSDDGSFSIGKSEVAFKSNSSPRKRRLEDIADAIHQRKRPLMNEGTSDNSKKKPPPLADLPPNVPTGGKQDEPQSSENMWRPW